MKITEEDVQKWLDKTRQIAFVFDVSSVLEHHPELTQVQAWEVLQQCAWECSFRSEHEDWIDCVDSIVEEMRDLEEDEAAS